MTSRIKVHSVDITVGERLREYRQRNGWSQLKLAQAIGVSFQQIQKYERGFNRISSSKLYAAAHALGVGVDDLFGGLPPTARHVTPPAIISLLADEDGAALALSLAALPGPGRAKALRILKLLSNDKVLGDTREDKDVSSKQPSGHPSEGFLVDQPR